MKTIESLTGTLNGSGTFDATNKVSNSVLWEHPDQPGYFILTDFSGGGLKLKKGSTEVAFKFSDLFDLGVLKEPALLPTLPAVQAAPASGAHPQTVTLTCAVAGVEIRYTTNGSTPTSSSTLYSAPISVAAALTLKAIAFKTYWQPSAMASFTYS